MGIELLGAGHYLPEKIVSNQDFEKLVETSNEWIVKRTGICNRHVSNGEYTIQMGWKAACNALKNAGVSAKEIDLIIFSTVSADFAFPSMSNILQGKLEAENAFGIDISCACSGFVSAFDMAYRYIKSDDNIKKVLIVCSENMTKWVDFSDRSTCVLFGDGAGAVVVSETEGENENEVFSILKTDGANSGLIYANLRHANNCFTTNDDIIKRKKEFESDFFVDEYDDFLYMNGRQVYRLAVEYMTNSVLQVCKKAKVELEDLAYIIPHQANARIIDSIVQKIGVPTDKVYVNIQNMGNISSACIPVCLSELFEGGKIKHGDKICLVSFGSGLIYGAVIFTV